MEFIPFEHASFIIKASGKVIYVDPVGDPAKYLAQGKPDLILITHTHHDHFVPALLNAVGARKSILLGPKAAIDELKYGEVMANGDTKEFFGFKIKAIPMYNTTKDRLKFHPKGWGNGYVLTINGKRVYISGDTEDIKEMRELKNIDYAFVCMNLPYTMTVEQAASAVLEFKPKVVFPYHYRGRNGFSDIHKFKRLVAKDPNIEVRFLDWYKNAHVNE